MVDFTSTRMNTREIVNSGLKSVKPSRCSLTVYIFQSFVLNAYRTVEDSRIKKKKKKDPYK